MSLDLILLNGQKVDRTLHHSFMDLKGILDKSNIGLSAAVRTRRPTTGRLACSALLVIGILDLNDAALQHVSPCSMTHQRFG